MMTRLALLCLAALALFGCKSNEKRTDTPGKAARDLKTVIDSKDKTYTSLFASQITVIKTDEEAVNLSMDGSHENEIWQAHMRIPRDQALSGQINVPVAPNRYGPTGGTIFLRNAKGDLIAATSGTFTATIANGQITGKVEAEPSSYSATFKGVLVVSCSVASDRPEAAPLLPGANLEPGKPTFLDDPDFKTTVCAPYKTLR